PDAAAAGAELRSVAPTCRLRETVVGAERRLARGSVRCPPVGVWSGDHTPVADRRSPLPLGDLRSRQEARSSDRATTSSLAFLRCECQQKSIAAPRCRPWCAQTVSNLGQTDVPVWAGRAGVCPAVFLFVRVDHGSFI